jgi:hypothetical protein
MIDVARDVGLFPAVNCLSLVDRKEKFAVAGVFLCFRDNAPRILFLSDLR